MFRESDSLIFQRVTGALRKPIVRFELATGRQVELLGFHLEPGWAFGDSPQPLAEEVARRLYPNERLVLLGEPNRAPEPAWLCLAYLYSDSPMRPGGVSNYSVLLVGGLVRDIGVGVDGLVCDLLAGVEWEAVATDDVMW
jgi:hypothetical protein